MILYMTRKEFMSGSELRQYLHISTRKMKYLMDNNYIPHENTGHTTHKYRVRTEDAVRFKARMDTEPGFLSELSGMFSNRTEWHPLPMFEATPENCEAFRRWLDSQWAELPEALPTQTAAELVGHLCKSVVVTAADFEGGVNKDVADVVVACNQAGKETIKRVEVGNIIFVDVDKTDFVRKVEAKGVAAFDCYNAAAGGFFSFFDAVDKEFGFAGAFKAKDKFDHFYVSLCSLLSLRERSLTEVD